MSRMKELYEKVAADSSLQAKFSKIMKDVEQTDEESLNKKIAAFAKDAGYDVTLDEMKDFFKEMWEPKEGPLSDAELDMVAGGKTRSDIPMQSTVSNSRLTVCYQYSPNISAVGSSTPGTCFKA